MGCWGSEWYCSGEERCMGEGCGEMSILAGKTVGGDKLDEEEINEEDRGDELYRDMNVNMEGKQQSYSVSFGFIYNMLYRSPDTDLPNFGSLFGFDHILKALEINFSEFKQTNQFAKAVSSILGIIDSYLANKINEAIKTAVQLPLDKLKDEAQTENKDFLNKIDENIQKIIKEQVKEEVKAQVSKILPKIKKTVNEQLKAVVRTHSSNASKTSYVGVSHWGQKRQQFYGFVGNREYARDVYSKSRIIAITELQIVEWYNYKHLDWITIHRDDEKLYKFKEGDYNMLRIQDIKDMLLLLVQGKLTNLTTQSANERSKITGHHLLVVPLYAFHQPLVWKVKDGLGFYPWLNWIEFLYLIGQFWIWMPLSWTQMCVLKIGRKGFRLSGLFNVTSSSFRVTSTGRGNVLKNPFFITEVDKDVIPEFSTIFSSKLFDFDVILIFNCFDEGHDGFRGFSFLLAVATIFSGSGKFFWQWELYTTTTDTTSGETGTKSRRTVTLTAEDMQKKKNDVKARTTLLLSLHDEHQLRFSKYKIARELWAAILKTFGGNEATKRTKKNLLKQQYGNFKAKGSETLEQTFSRLQVIIGRLQFMDVEVEHDDLNQKFLIFDSNVSFEEELVYQRLRKTLTHVLELSSCIYLDDRAR
nr:hypothetical protein [Tanacetum cinerariifolium]